MIKYTEGFFIFMGGVESIHLTVTIIMIKISS